MKKTLALILVLVMALSLLTSCGDKPASTPDGAADDGQTYILRIGTGTGGKDKQVAWMEHFEVALEEATNGRIDVQCYPAGQLGTMAEMVQGCVDGSVDASCYPTTYFSTVFAGASIVDLPNLAPYGGAQIWNILMTQDTLLEEVYEQHGVVPVSWLLVPDRTIISTEKIDSIDDFQGKVIWATPSAVLLKELELLGAVPSTINVGELAPSLSNGTVEGAATDITLYASQSLQTSGGNYLLEAPGDCMVSIFGISKIWWDKLPADLQQIVRDVANQTVLEFEVDYVKNQVAGAYEKMQADGMEVVIPSDEFQADLDAAFAGIADWFLETYPEAKEVYDDFVARIEADTGEYDRF